MSILVPRLQKLNFQDTDGETVLPFEDFIKLLRQNLTDRDKNIRVDNIKVELSNKNELRKIAGKIFVTFQSIVVYTASHINDYHVELEGMEIFSLAMTLYNSNVEHIGVLLFPHRILQIS
jgi:hypothetical protein